MTRDEARLLRKGDRVMFASRTCESIGTVVESNYVWFVVHWDKSYWGDPVYNYAIYGDEGTLTYLHRMN